MDKIFSARLDETTINQLNRAARRLGMTKKRFLEEAIRLRAHQAEGNCETDVWAETAGAWRRSGSFDTTVRETRRKLENALGRHHRGKHARLHR